MRTMLLGGFLAGALACRGGPDGAATASGSGSPPGAGSPAPAQAPTSGACPAAAPGAALAPIDVAWRPASAAMKGPDANAAACTGIAPPDDVPTQQFGTPMFPSCRSSCMSGAGDARGLLAFPQEYYDSICHDTGVSFVASADASPVGSSDGAPIGLTATTLQQPAGVVVVGRAYLGPSPRPAGITAWDSAGRALGSAAVQAKKRVDAFGPDPGFLDAFAADPSGGVLFAGDLRVDPSAPFQHAAVMFGVGGGAPEVRWGPVALDSAGAVLGVGVDVRGRSLVLTDGEDRFGAGTVAAQWFDGDGRPLTCAFALLSRYTAISDRAWLEATPLVGGGLAVARVDLTYGAVPLRTGHAAAVAIVDSGAASFAPAPAWMTARPDTTLRLVRGGRAYAVLPFPATLASCVQRVEVLAPDGTLCGARDYPVAEGPCTTRAITVAADGTVIQQLPAALEQSADDGPDGCAWRWWTGALR